MHIFGRLGLTVAALATFPGVWPAQAAPTTVAFNFDWRNEMIFVPVRVNGSRPLSFVLDTGSARNLIDRSLATALGLKASGTGSLQGAGAGRIPVSFIHNVSIAFPGMESGGYEFATADLQPLKASLGVTVDGILGYEVSPFCGNGRLSGEAADVDCAGSISPARRLRSNVAHRIAREMGFCEGRARVARTGSRAGYLHDR